MRATVLCMLLGGAVAAQPVFRRGDANDDARIDIADAVCTLTYLFGGPEGACRSPGCLDALDANDDGSLTIADPIYLLNFLFAGYVLPQPRGICGPDPTEDSLTCMESACFGPRRLVLEIPEGTSLYSIWSENLPTVDLRQAYLSAIDFRAGSYDLRLGGETQEVNLLESVRFGPDLSPAQQLDGGSFSPLARPTGYTHQYTQRFETPRGILTFHLSLKTGEQKNALTRLLLDCAFLDSGENCWPWAELTEATSGTLSLQYSCFSERTWRPSRQFYPMVLVLLDGTSLSLYLQDAYFFRGVAGETTNRRLQNAQVTYGGESLEVEEFGRILYAAQHHNWNQEYRILFPRPFGEIFGIDIVENPPDSGQFFLSWPIPGVSKAYLLNADLSHISELEIESVTFPEP